MDRVQQRGDGETGWTEGKEREEKSKLKINEFFYVDKMKRCEKKKSSLF